MVNPEDSCIFKYKEGYSNTCTGDCRNYKFKLITNKDQINSILQDNGLDGFIYNKCLEAKEVNEFRDYMNKNHSNFTFINQKRDHELCPLNALASIWNLIGTPEWQYIVAYKKNFSTGEENYSKCCSTPKQEREKLKNYACSPEWCNNSEECSANAILLGGVCGRSFWNKDICATTFKNANVDLQNQMVSSKTGNIVAVMSIDNFKEPHDRENLGKSIHNKAIDDSQLYNLTLKNMLSSNADTSKIQDNLKKVCNDESIFDGTDWDKKLESYGKICSCFWDPNKNNGNPANLQKKKIEALKSKEGLPDDLKEYAQFVSDIDPSGPTYCWDSQCTNNDENLIPNRSQCPSTNIASCLAYVNFDNKGIIKGNVSNIAKCAANLKDETLNNMLISGRGAVDKTRNGSDTSNGSGTKPKKKKNNTTIWIIVGVVILLIIIIAVGAYALY